MTIKEQPVLTAVLHNDRCSALYGSFVEGSNLSTGRQVQFFDYIRFLWMLKNSLLCQAAKLFWKDLESIEQWEKNQIHRDAKSQGNRRYLWYKNEIAQVIHQSEKF